MISWIRRCWGTREQGADVDVRDEQSDINPIDTAWRIHQAQSDWTSKVDAKAAFAFAIESAAIATVVGLTAKDRLFSNLDQWWLVLLFVLGLILLLAAAGLAALVVIPRLRKDAAAKEARDNFIYFGHARLWNAAQLEDALRSQDILPQLSRQIINMAEIAWVKHIRVQWSFGLAIAGGVLLVACGLLGVG
ncbi:DUF5706 domain-containing protein (plasmid) [Paenarthrobacter sp. SD-1]|uniref:DUF5706 domain-containing protein n=1 Tax=Paenarthrobacter ureafaciens TaxID=37931 RepID=A0AAX3EQ11_PAEUR|nr:MULTISPECIES: Pycsar system effector family protein [Paenarthrobacter]MDO5878312.1 DUF5706 domain-containing protein [Paenarthrobacter sp. SD-1]UYW00228.1 DUF5706 domain-containing protein [Paenarthrobacter ureafaciens]